jgi:hypothetical protein
VCTVEQPCGFDSIVVRGGLQAIAKLCAERAFAPGDLLFLAPAGQKTGERLFVAFFPTWHMDWSGEDGSAPYAIANSSKDLQVTKIQRGRDCGARFFFVVAGGRGQKTVRRRADRSVFNALR